MRKLALSRVLLLLGLLAMCPLLAQQRLTEAVNSSYQEQAATVTPDGDALYFIRKEHPRNLGQKNTADIWFSRKSEEGGWTKGINAGAPLNSSQTEQLAGWVVPTQRLYIYRPEDKELLSYRRNGRFWRQAARQLIAGIDQAGLPLQFTVSADGQVLLGVYDSNGQRDLYISFAEGNHQWSQPSLLPTTINSPEQEQSAFLAADQRSLYFSSNRPGGEGGYDLYFSRRTGDGWKDWSPAKNLGPSINTAGDESFLSLPASGQPAYFTRQTGDRVDIWTASLPDEVQASPMLLVEGDIQVEGQQPASRLQPVIQLETADAPLQALAKPSPRGQFQALLPPDASGSLIAEVPGYFAVSQPLTTSTDIPRDREMDYALVALSDNATYRQRDAEIEELQLYLQEVDEDLLKLQQQRAAAKAELQRTFTNKGAEFSDPEIDALRHKYNYFLLEAEQMLPDTIDLPDDGYDEKAAKAKEVADMNARFSRYYIREKAQQQAKEELNNGEERMWEEAPTFEELQAQARRELERELQSEVAQSYAKGISVQERESAVPTLSEEEKAALQQQQQQLREQIAAGFEQAPQRQQPQPEQWTAKTPQAKSPLWEQRVRADLKEAMREEVKSELEEAAQHELTTFAEADLAYRQARLRQSTAQKKLQQKMQQQVQTEQQYKQLPDETVAPLTPQNTAPIPPSGEATASLLLVPAELGRTIPLNNVIFEANKNVLLPQSYAELNRVLAFLRQNESLTVEIGTHVQGAISHANALQLTQERATAITNFLIGNGLPPNRVQSRGYGKTFPLTGGEKPQRVELRIIGKKEP